jgi:hypothetical protein
MIKPTVGRIVWYYGSKDLVIYQPLSAIICFVESDEKVNLHVFGAKGECFPRERVRLVQDLEKSKASDNLPDSEFCTWMPFQKAQPAVAEAVETRLKVLEIYVAERLGQVESGKKEQPDPKIAETPVPVVPPVKQVTK